MKMRQTVSLLFVTMMLLAAGDLPAGEKPEPSKHLGHAFRMFLLLEEKIERLDWDAAAGVGRVVRAELLSRAEELRTASGQKKVDDFLYEFGRLLKRIESRSIEESLSAYRTAETGILDIYGDFSFRTHPVIPILDAEVHEALDYLRENNLPAAAMEMEEIVVYFRTAREVLGAESYPHEEVETLDREIRRASALIGDGDAKAAAESLAGIAGRTSKLITR